MSELVTVPFHGDTLFAVRDGAQIRFALKSITDRLGLDWTAQLRRTKRDAILAEGMAIMTIPSPGGTQETATLPLSLLPGWLFGIGANQVKAEARDLVLTYQRECHDVLFRRFFAPRDEAPVPFDPARQEPVSVRRGLVMKPGRRSAPAPQARSGSPSACRSFPRCARAAARAHSASPTPPPPCRPLRRPRRRAGERCSDPQAHGRTARCLPGALRRNCDRGPRRGSRRRERRRGREARGRRAPTADARRRAGDRASGPRACDRSRRRLCGSRGRRAMPRPGRGPAEAE